MFILPQANSLFIGYGLDPVWLMIEMVSKVIGKVGKEAGLTNDLLIGIRE